jgi:hypothetical protein
MTDNREQNAHTIISEVLQRHSKGGDEQYDALVELAAHALRAIATLVHVNNRGARDCPLCLASDAASERAHVLAGMPTGQGWGKVH